MKSGKVEGREAGKSQALLQGVVGWFIDVRCYSHGRHPNPIDCSPGWQVIGVGEEVALARVTGAQFDDS